LARTASSAYVEYGYETSFGNGGIDAPLVFGREQKAVGLEAINNQIPLGQLNSPEIECFVYGRNEGKVSMEYVLSNPWIFTSLLGQPVETGASTPFTNTWDSRPSTPPVGQIRDIESLFLEIGFEGITGNVVREISGVVSPSMALRMSINEPIRVTQELIWGQDSVNTTLDTSVSAKGDFTPYVFANASLQLPSGTSVATIQDLDLNLNSNAELLYELGKANSVDAYRKILEMTGKINLTMKDKTNIDRIFARTEILTMKVFITNGLTGSSKKDITIDFRGVGLSLHSNSGIEPGELVLENVDFQCRSVTITAVSDTRNQPS